MTDTLVRREHQDYATGEEYVTYRDPELESAAREERGHSPGATMQPLFQFKDSDVLGYGQAVNEYMEYGQPVNDFTLEPPSMEINHVADLCVCQHSRLQHSAAVTHDICSGKRRDGEQCRCERMNPVSPKGSKHAFRRGMGGKKRRLADLVPGDRVLAGWAATTGKVRLTDVKTGALVVTVEARRNKLPDSAASGQSWFERAVIITTDLGETVPQSGGTYVWTVAKGK